MTQEVQPRSTGAGSWLRWAVAAFFGLIYAFAIWSAVFAWTQWTANLTTAGGKISTYGTVMFLLPVIFPAIVWVAAFIIGRRRRVWQLALLYVAGICLLSVFWINIVMQQMTDAMLAR